MSKAAVGEILARTLRDSTFAARLKADPERVLAELALARPELELTDAERAAILAGLHSTGGGAPLAQRPRVAGRIV